GAVVSGSSRARLPALLASGHRHLPLRTVRSRTGLERVPPARGWCKMPPAVPPIKQPGRPAGDARPATSGRDPGQHVLGGPEVREHVVRAAGDELVGAVAPGRDAERARTARLTAGDVPRRVPDDDRVAGVEAPSPHLRGAPQRDRGKAVAILVVRSVAPEAEALPEAGRAELEPGPALDVSREEAERDVLDGAERVEELVDSGQHLHRSPGEPLLQEPEVARPQPLEPAVDLLGAEARALEQLPRDLRV